MLGVFEFYANDSSFNIDAPITKPYIRRTTPNISGTLPFTSEEVNNKLFIIFGWSLGNSSYYQLAYNPYDGKWRSRVYTNNKWYGWNTGY